MSSAHRNAVMDAWRPLEAPLQQLEDEDAFPCALGSLEAEVEAVAVGMVRQVDELGCT